MIAALLLAAAVHPCANEQTQIALDVCWSRRVGSALAAVQSAWATAAEKTCALASVLYQGGSIEPMMEAECDANVTDERVARLDLARRSLLALGKP